MYDHRSGLTMKIEYIEAVFQDEYSQPKKVYFPGQTVSGVLKFRVSEDFTVNSKYRPSELWLSD